MMIKEQMEKIYGEIALDAIPWNVEAAPEILRTAVASRTTRLSKVIEFGCGAGNYVIALSRMGFDVTGVDIAENAIEIARRSAVRAGVACRFVASDVLGDLSAVTDKYDFGYDWELLHHIFPEDRERYVRNVCRLLNPGATHLTVCFSEDDPQFGGVGKYRATPLGTVLYFSSEAEVESLFAKCFVVEELKTIELAGRRGSHRAVYALVRKKSS